MYRAPIEILLTHWEGLSLPSPERLPPPSGNCSSAVPQNVSSVCWNPLRTADWLEPLLLDWLLNEDSPRFVQTRQTLVQDAIGEGWFKNTGGLWLALCRRTPGLCQTLAPTCYAEDLSFALTAPGYNNDEKRQQAKTGQL